MTARQVRVEPAPTYYDLKTNITLDGKRLQVESSPERHIPNIVKLKAQQRKSLTHSSSLVSLRSKVSHPKLSKEELMRQSLRVLRYVKAK